MKKKSQQEILGFVLIVVLVTIIGVVFLSFSIGSSKPTKQTSAEISNLLEATMYSTSDCAINYIPQYREIQDLIKDCYNNPEQTCITKNACTMSDYTGISGRTDCTTQTKVCQALESTMKQLISSSLQVSDDAPNKAYTLKIYYVSLNSLNETKDILSITEGSFTNCSSNPGGSHSIAVTTSSGSIETELELCKSSI